MNDLRGEVWALAPAAGDSRRCARRTRPGQSLRAHKSSRKHDRKRAELQRRARRPRGPPSTPKPTRIREPGGRKSAWKELATHVKTAKP